MRILTTTTTRPRILLIHVFWIVFQACTHVRMTQCHLLASFCSSRHHYPITRSSRRRHQERSVMVVEDQRGLPSLGLKAVTESSSSTDENNEMYNDQANKEEKEVSSFFDQDTHLRILNDNLQRFSGKSLLQHMKNAEEADDNKDSNNKNSGDGDDDDADDAGDSMRRTIGGLMETIIGNEEDGSYDANTNDNDVVVDQHDDDSYCWSPDDVHMSLRFVLLSHGAINGMDGPVHNYANFAALSIFSYTRQQMLRIPACRLAAPGAEQADLAEFYRMLREKQRSSTSTSNIVENHEAFHCTQYLQRFFIRNALVSLFQR
jgi:MEKHLA domain